MKIREVGYLPFVQVTLEHQGVKIKFENALLDTGSAATVFPSELLEESGIEPPPNAIVREISGIGGGMEYVLEYSVDAVEVNGLRVEDFVIHSGQADYGYGFNAFVGFDFLKATRALVDFGRMQIGVTNDLD